MNILDEIVAHKKTEVARLPAFNADASVLRAALQKRGGARDFLGALRRPARGSALVSGSATVPVAPAGVPPAGARTQLGVAEENAFGGTPKAAGETPALPKLRQHPARGAVALIAEVKKASPSAGVIRADFDPVAIAREYEAAGASCLSVLTDEKFFQGSPAYLRQIRAAVKLPLLRKDFIIDERQIPESIEMGADAILLIVRILDDARLARLHALADGAGLSVLVEVHDEAEMERALSLGAKLVGVNNRNLDTFQVDLAVTGRLAAKISDEARKNILLVAESGIHTRADVERLRQEGAAAILVGESLMKAPAGITAQISDLLGE